MVFAKLPTFSNHQPPPLPTLEASIRRQALTHRLVGLNATIGGENQCDVNNGGAGGNEKKGKHGGGGKRKGKAGTTGRPGHGGGAGSGDGKIVLSGFENTEDFVDNERMEFFGDGLLYAYSAALLFKEFPRLKQGLMSKIREQLVTNSLLSRICVLYGLEQDLILPLPKSYLRKTVKVQADVFEAYVAAVRLYRGNETCEAWIHELLRPYARELYELYRKEALNNLQHGKPCVGKKEDLIKGGKGPLLYPVGQDLSSDGMVGVEGTCEDLRRGSEYSDDTRRLAVGTNDNEMISTPSPTSSTAVSDSEYQPLDAQHRSSLYGTFGTRKEDPDRNLKQQKENNKAEENGGGFFWKAIFCGFSLPFFSSTRSAGDDSNLDSYSNETAGTMTSRGRDGDSQWGTRSRFTRASSIGHQSEGILAEDLESGRLAAEEEHDVGVLPKVPPYPSPLKDLGRRFSFNMFASSQQLAEPVGKPPTVSRPSDNSQDYNAVDSSDDTSVSPASSVASRSRSHSHIDTPNTTPSSGCRSPGPGEPESPTLKVAKLKPEVGIVGSVSQTRSMSHESLSPLATPFQPVASSSGGNATTKAEVDPFAARSVNPAPPQPFTQFKQKLFVENPIQFLQQTYAAKHPRLKWITHSTCVRSGISRICTCSCTTCSKGYHSYDHECDCSCESEVPVIRNGRKGVAAPTRWHVDVCLDGNKITSGDALTKKEAKMFAAEKAIRVLQLDYPSRPGTPGRNSPVPTTSQLPLPSMPSRMSSPLLTSMSQSFGSTPRTSATVTKNHAPPAMRLDIPSFPSLPRNNPRGSGNSLQQQQQSRFDKIPSPAASDPPEMYYKYSQTGTANKPKHYFWLMRDKACVGFGSAHRKYESEMGARADATQTLGRGLSYTKNIPDFLSGDIRIPLPLPKRSKAEDSYQALRTLFLTIRDPLPRLVYVERPPAQDQPWWKVSVKIDGNTVGISDNPIRAQARIEASESAIGWLKSQPRNKS